MNFLEPLIEFYSDNHSYWCGEEKFKSVGFWIKSFTPSFDENYWLTYKVFEKLYPEEFSDFKKKNGFKPDINLMVSFLVSKLSHSLVEDEKLKLKWQWEKKGTISRTKGSVFHSLMEDIHKKSQQEINEFDRRECICHWNAKTFDNESLTDNLFNLADGCYSELLIWNMGIKTAGQSDKVYITTIGNDRFVDIKDFKTNEEKPDTKCYDKFLPPLEHLCANTHNKYSFQISFYAWMMEQFGFKVRYLGYQWHPDYNPKQYKLIQVPYLEKEVREAIEFLNFK